MFLGALTDTRSQMTVKVLGPSILLYLEDYSCAVVLS